MKYRMDRNRKIETESTATSKTSTAVNSDELDFQRDRGKTGKTVVVNLFENVFCEECGESFEGWTNFERHKQEKHEVQDKSFKCENCTASFATLEYLENHVKNHHGSNAYQCDICSESFDNKHHLLWHNMNHEKQSKIFKCEQCFAIFGQKLELYEHLVKSHIKKYHQCKICHQLFDTKQYLNFHLQSHYVKCDKCPKTFATKSELDFHLWAHTIEVKRPTGNKKFQVGEKSFQCGNCSQLFASAAFIRGPHAKNCTEVKPFVCEICHLRFVRHEHLELHMETHNQSQNSDQNSNSLQNSSQARRKLKMLFKCELCPKVFHTTSALHYHAKEHRLVY